ncbi:MAG TPA: alpha/beta hydrolase-fold protein, partial [Cytophagaceae bacterium]
MGIRTLATTLIIGFTLPAFCQIQIKGRVIDSKTKNNLSYVNIGIKGKNIGAISNADGSFSIDIPQDQIPDTLTFSLVGYDEFKELILVLKSKGDIRVQLDQKSTQLNEVVIKQHRLVEKKYGIKKTGIIHFVDGIFKKDDSFEIGQVINLGAKPVKLTSVNLHINSSRIDSANFRINFYKYDEEENQPTERIIEKSIIQRHAIRAGWLKFDLVNYNIRLKGKIFASIEFIPENKDVQQIFYEIKIGGSSKSFFRKSSLGQWVRPPHHYCLFVTALTDKKAPVEVDDVEPSAALVLQSDFSKEPYSIFVRLPKDYSKESQKVYPVMYHLDGNAFFDPIVNSAELLSKKRRIAIEPIIVGIGYKNAYVMDSLRGRDYTYPTSLPIDSFGISGEGANFYNFIKAKVIPRIDSAYRTDKSNRTIMGHSLGGYFVLYSLLRHSNDQSIFQNYVAASPSLDYEDNYLIKQFENSPSSTNNLKKARVYLTMGELELENNKPNGFYKLSQSLAKKEF